MTVTLPTMHEPFAPPHLLRAASEIIQRLNQDGHEAYVAGGAVRDYLLGRPQSDLDIATSATPAQVRRLFARTFAVGESFGVILVRHRGRNFEVATFREESDYTDGRHPGTVRFATARADVARRDFTINGMLFDVLRGEVLDWVGGRADVEARIIRTIGDPSERFAEDRLRMLRAVRFAAQLDFAIEPSTLQAVGDLAPHLRVVSLERVRQELDKLLAAGGAQRGLHLLWQCGLWEVIRAWLREEASTLARREGWAPGIAEGTPWLKAWLDMRQESASTEWGATPALCALLLDVLGPSPADLQPGLARTTGLALGMLVRALRGSREEVSQLEGAARILCHLRQIADDSLARQLRLVRMPEFAWAMAMAEHHPAFGETPFAHLRELVACHRDSWHPRPLLSGNDLMAFGISPGPALGELMHAQEDAQLEGRLVTVDDAWEWVRERTRATSEGGKS